MPEVDQDTISRPQSRQRQTTGRRLRNANGQQSHQSRQEMTRSNPNLMNRPEDSPTSNLQMTSRRIQRDDNVPCVNGRTELAVQLKPAPSRGEPLRIIRTYGNTNKGTVSTGNTNGMDGIANTEVGSVM